MVIDHFDRSLNVKFPARHRASRAADQLCALRADPATEHIPVISVTAMVMDEDVERAMNTGCDGLLPKPYTQDEFFSAILSVVGDPVAV